MRIRALTTFDECRRVVALEKEVWGYTDAEDVVPAPVLVVGIKRGAILLGAFDDSDAMKGFVYSIPAIKNGALTQWSHMLGVARDAQGWGIGRRLKLAQWEHALAMGIELIEWTFDPMQALNAHLNFARLGVVAEEYDVNIYGESSSPLHRGTPTDRLVAEWKLTAPHVERRLASDGVALVRDASISAAPIVNPSREQGGWLRPGAADPTLDARRVLVEIPIGFSEMQIADPATALEWRLAVRSIFQTYFSKGYRAVDFFLSKASGRGHYLLALKEAEAAHEASG